MRSKSGTVRMIDGYHRLTKLREYSSVDFDLSDEQLAAEHRRRPCREEVGRYCATASAASGSIPSRCARSTALTLSETPSLA